MRKSEHLKAHASLFCVSSIRVATDDEWQLVRSKKYCSPIVTLALMYNVNRSSISIFDDGVMGIIGKLGDKNKH